MERGNSNNLGTTRTLGGKPRDLCSHEASAGRHGRAGVASHSPPADIRPPSHRRPLYPAKDIADRISGAKYVELPGRNVFHFVEPWRQSFQGIAQFLTGQQPDVADDRVLATVLFTDIVNSTPRAAAMGDRDWHALTRTTL